VKTATADQISRFLNYYGDQHIGNGHRHFYTSSHQLADDLQELLLRVGKRASFYERKPRNVQMADGRKIDAENCSSDITIIERSMDNLSIERRKNIKLQTYKGMVYCATVPNSLLVTRRNGSILISGNSCTSNAIGAAIQYERLKYNSSPDFVPSRLFIYYNERAMERTIPLDAGAMIRDGIKSVSSHGVCPESDWPYHATPADPDTNLFPAKSPPVTKPPAKAYLNAKQYTAISYFRIQQNLNQLKGCLAAGYPFVFGFVVYTNLYTTAGDPVVHLTLPSGTDSALGGHAVMAVGYDDAKAEFIIRNSWGDKVQDHGNFYMPYSYLTDNNLADDIWTIRKMTA
jgi:C1A family cysteine protease